MGYFDSHGSDFTTRKGEKRDGNKETGYKRRERGD
jgi:hypothetical protein